MGHNGNFLEYILQNSINLRLFSNEKLIYFLKKKGILDIRG